VGDVTRRTLLHAGFERARAMLARLFDERGAAKGARPRMALRAPVVAKQRDGDVVTRRVVIATFSPGREVDGIKGAIAVTWEASAGGSFPRFAGRLWVEPRTASTSWLRLDGSFDRTPGAAPGSEVGEAALGNRIVLATAKMLLDQVGHEIEKLQRTG
jgi:hypothetical protein